jgi:hypothetical protein
MPQPFPPQGNQTQHTERPLKVYAEQYLEGGALPVGAVIFPMDPLAFPPPLFVDGLPRVSTPTGWIVVASTDWVISNRYTGAPIEVISDEEFTERFGIGGGPPVPGA